MPSSIKAACVGFAAIAIIGLATSPVWSLNFSEEEVAAALKNFEEKMEIINELNTYDIKNAQVYVGDGAQALNINIFNLLACFHQTNPNSKMDVDGGGGFDIEMQNVQFAKGKYDAHIRMMQKDKIDFLDKEKILVLSKVQVGAIILKAPDQRIEVIEWMSKACLKK